MFNMVTACDKILPLFFPPLLSLLPHVLYDFFAVCYPSFHCDNEIHLEYRFIQRRIIYSPGRYLGLNEEPVLVHCFASGMLRILYAKGVKKIHLVFSGKEWDVKIIKWEHTAKETYLVSFKKYSIRFRWINTQWSSTEEEKKICYKNVSPAKSQEKIQDVLVQGYIRENCI